MSVAKTLKQLQLSTQLMGANVAIIDIVTYESEVPNPLIGGRKSF